MGHQASEIANGLALAHGWPIPDAWSLKEVERFYCHTGVTIDGPVEMRSSWKYNDLKPRIYYAQGPTVYSVSKYDGLILEARMVRKGDDDWLLDLLISGEFRPVYGLTILYNLPYWAAGMMLS